MLMKPSLFDIKYDKMNENERLFNYERDVLLYEQAQSLEQIAKSVNPTKSELDYSDPITKFQLGALSPLGYFEAGSPEYFEFMEIADEGKKCIKHYANLDVIKTLFIYLLVCAITFGIPLNFTSVPDIVKVIGIASLPIAIIGIIITSLLMNEQHNKANIIDKQLTKYKYENKLKEE